MDMRPAPFLCKIQNNLSFRTTQANITTLLDSLDNDETFQESTVESMHKKALDHFNFYKQNSSSMQSEFNEILDGFKNGNASSEDFEMLLKEYEQERNESAASSASEISRHLEHIFWIIKEACNDKSISGLSTNNENVNEIINSLDQAMETTAMLTLNYDVSRTQNLNTKNRLGHFSKLLRELSLKSIRNTTIEEYVLVAQNDFSCQVSRINEKVLYTSQAFSITVQGSSIKCSTETDNSSSSSEKLIPYKPDITNEIDLTLLKVSSSLAKISQVSHIVSESKGYMSPTSACRSRSDSLSRCRTNSNGGDAIETSSSPSPQRTHRMRFDSPLRVRRPNPINTVETIAMYPISMINKSTSTTDLLHDGDSGNNLMTYSTVSPITSYGEWSVSPSKTELLSKLSSAENPLLLIYHIYKNELPEIAKSRLLSLATGDACTSSLSLVDKTFSSVLQELEKFYGQVTLLEKSIQKTSESFPLQTVTSSVDSNESLLIHATIEKANIELGIAATTLLSLQLQLTEYRGLFERIASTELSRLPKLLKSSVNFNDSYQQFTECQGRLASLSNRIKQLKLTNIKSEVIRGKGPALLSKISRSNTPTLSQIWEGNPSESKDKDKDKDYLNYKIALEQAQSKIVRLEDELVEAENDIEELQCELLESKEASDKTPAAILFFSILQEENVMPTLQQLILQLGQIRTITDAAEHMDFQTLRRRLQVCVECLPGIKLLVTKYTTLFQKWSEERKKLLLRRKQTTHNTDINNLCPLCYGDLQAQQPPPPQLQQQLQQQQSSSSTTTTSSTSTTISRDINHTKIDRYRGPLQDHHNYALGMITVSRMNSTDRPVDRILPTHSHELPPLISRSTSRSSRR